MIARRTVPVVAGFVLVALGVTGLATPAYATDATIACTNPGNTDSTLSGSGPWTFVLGSCDSVGANDYVRVSVSSTPLEIRGPADGPQLTVYTSSDPMSLNYDRDITGDANRPSSYTGSDPYGTVTLGVKVTYTPVDGPTSGTITVEFKDGDVPDLRQTFNITLGDGGGGDTPSGDGDTPSGDTGSTALIAGPGPHVQEFGMPESGTCDEAAGAAHNWAGVASGGWGESWAQWANDGAGGAVCSRTLVYNASQGAWKVD